MVSNTPSLIVIVDPDYGERLEKAAEVAPVWIVATAANKDVCLRLWKVHPHVDHREIGAITHYDCADPNDRIGNLLEELPTLGLHHGELDGDEIVFPDGFVLEVIGLALSDKIQSAL
jgi:hypothetical protein